MSAHQWPSVIADECSGGNWNVGRVLYHPQRARAGRLLTVAGYRLCMRSTTMERAWSLEVIGSASDVACSRPLDLLDQEAEDKPGEEPSEESEVNQTAELCDADMVESALPREARRRAELQAERAACDPERLQRLKLRCERIVHACVATLTLHLTQHRFNELEEEMQRAVCWYLSCDRYWEDTAPAARAFPWPLLLALITGLALALFPVSFLITIPITLLILLPFTTLVFDSSPVLNYGSGLAFGSDLGPVLDSAHRLAINFDSATHHSSNFNESGVQFTDVQVVLSFSSEESSVAGSASVSMTTQSSPARGERLTADDALIEQEADHDDHYIYVTYPPGPQKEASRKVFQIRTYAGCIYTSCANFIQ
ncbi:hypothetical protein EVAR_42508_1 [Eumeta japonica]|uniref:Uncharacterized protein n=1 Tax=Eumeta variegata TaxID=151549 RepID=A0A4C1XE46_EUMVA|nr:hypothetical protein EVAR_42508_1 [Eumeta japonica]